MNSLIESLNQWGENFLSFAWPMLWQSSLLIVALLAFEFLFRRRLRASIRYALWLVVLVKLCVPPTLALPTSPAWWWHATPPPVAAKPLPHFTVTYTDAPLPEMPPAPLPVFVSPPPVMTFASWLLVVSAAVSFTLFGWMLVRWWQVARMVRRATTAEQFSEALDDAWRLAGTPIFRSARFTNADELPGLKTGVPNARQTSVRLKIVAGRISPAVCGLFRPTILLPQSLAENFSDEQLRAVLLHELIHLRRRDVWVNCLQALLQIFYWWHPLVWVANARIRRVREEAVDDAVMLALRGEAETYAPTLLEVAKLALNRPLASLGLVGIMESRSALRQRIERLMDFHAPRHAGLTLVSLLGILAFTAVAVPMGEGPASVPTYQTATLGEPEITTTSGRGENRMSLPITVQLKQSTNSSLVGIMADPNFRTKLHALEKRSDFDSLGEPAATTTSGRMTQLRNVNRVENIAGLTAKSGTVSQATHPPQVWITGWIYQMRASETEKIIAGLKFNHAVSGGDPWWTASPEQFRELMQHMESTGLEPIIRPRILGNDGQAAMVYLGDSTNFSRFDCTPYVVGGQIDLALHGQVVNTKKTGMITNQFSARTSAENFGGFVMRVENMDGFVESNVVMLASAEIVTNSARFQQRLNSVIKRTDGSITNTGVSRQIILDKLNRIRFESVVFDGIPLSEVLRQLSEKSRQADSEHKGINFLINPNADQSALAKTSPPMRIVAGIDPATGLPAARTEATALDVGTFTVKLNLTDVRLADVLAAIVGVAQNPNPGDKREISFSIKDYGIVFQPKVTEAPQLFTREFKVDTNLFLNGLRSMGRASGLGLTNLSISKLASQVFTNLGVNLESPPGKAVFYNDRSGKLLVRATAADLDLIEQTIGALNQVTPQIHIKARFIEVPKGNFEVLQKLIGTTLAFGLSNSFAGILTSTNTSRILRTLESIKGFKSLGEPEITTTSGRQCQMRATQMMSVVTNLLPTSSTSVPQTTSVEIGPVLDVVPYVLADDYTLNLAVIPSVTEFLGYEISPTNSLLKLPSFLVRQTVSTLNLLDGQTAIIGGLSQTAMVGGVSTQSKPNDKELVVMITANIVDPAGNRVHTDEQIELVRKGIPSQSLLPQK